MSDDVRPALPVEPWSVSEVGFDPRRLGRMESLFTVSNGYLGVRGTFDEGAPIGVRGTYLNGFHRTCHLSYPEPGYGDPGSSEELVDVTDGTVMRLMVEDEPLGLDDGRVLDHRRRLDFRTGTLSRFSRWRSPNGRLIEVHSTRLVSFTHRGIMAIRYQVRPVEQPLRVVLQSELVANQPRPAVPGGAATAAPDFLIPEGHSADATRSWLVHRVDSGSRVVVVADHQIDAAAVPEVQTDADEHRTRTSMTVELPVDQTLTVTKVIQYAWAEDRSIEALQDEAGAGLDAALEAGWTGLVAEQQAYLDRYWAGADVEVAGDPEVQQAVRFGLFHLLQASARADGRPLPAKGLTGDGYSGHVFWDTERFVLPVLTATHPDAAAAALGWRRRTLPLARRRAAELRLAGASFPWRTITGEECGPYWPAGTAAFHVNAAIADAVARHVAWTHDREFERDVALPLLVETARLWMSLGHLGVDGAFHLDGLTGPDEYSAVKDDNTYTNLTAARNLRAAAEVAERLGRAAAELDVSTAERRSWQDTADRIAVPYDASGIPEQHRGASTEQGWDFAASAEQGRYPLHKHHPYFDLYRKAVRKQADLVLALHWCGDRFTARQKQAAFLAAEALTVRDSSLSASAQAILAAEIGYLQLAHDYLREVALTDIGDWRSDTDDGLHLASLAGAWLVLVCGFGGLRDHDDRLAFAPRLPDQLESVSFTLAWRNSRLRVRVTADAAHYAIAAGTQAVELRHHGKTITVSPGEDVKLPLPPFTPPSGRPRQPVGREPGPIS
jgi:alpha,alpha-trehalose phosphorylase